MLASNERLIEFLHSRGHNEAPDNVLLEHCAAYEVGPEAAPYGYVYYTWFNETDLSVHLCLDPGRITRGLLCDIVKIPELLGAPRIWADQPTQEVFGIMDILGFKNEGDNRHSLEIPHKYGAYKWGS